MRIALFAAALLSSSAFAAEPSREHFAPKGWEGSYHKLHYTPVVKIGEMVIISGIPAGPGDTYEAKIEALFENVKTHLETAGATMADVVEINTFHVDARDSKALQAEIDRFAPIHHRHFPSHYPAWTAVGTSALYSEGAPVEMRVVAIIGSGKAPKADIPQPLAE